MTNFTLREVYDINGRLVAVGTSTDAARAAMRLLGQPGSGARVIVSHVDHAAGIVTVRGGL